MVHLHSPDLQPLCQSSSSLESLEECKSPMPVQDGLHSCWQCTCTIFAKHPRSCLLLTPP
ncbi:uncharacterized protein LOC119163782 isoform X4 [Rhipicephalus microplus]|uniref:uncharacterized protein LOC119163782 isoform X4 n=1 Tax=Rhipicephalus microplus TaxID=6941 RepID=UPI003F6D8E46